MIGLGEVGIFQERGLSKSGLFMPCVQLDSLSSLLSTKKKTDNKNSYRVFLLSNTPTPYDLPFREVNTTVNRMNPNGQCLISTCWTRISPMNRMIPCPSGSLF